MAAATVRTIGACAVDTSVISVLELTQPEPDATDAVTLSVKLMGQGVLPWRVHVMVTLLPEVTAGQKR